MTELQLEPLPEAMEAKAALEAWASVDRSAWTPAARSADFIEMLETWARFDAVLLQEMGEWDRDKCWAEDHALSAASWLVHRVPVTKAKAMVLVRTARLTAQHE